MCHLYDHSFTTVQTPRLHCAYCSKTMVHFCKGLDGWVGWEASELYFSVQLLKSYSASQDGRNSTSISCIMLAILILDSR